MKLIAATLGISLYILICLAAIATPILIVLALVKYII